MCRKQKLEKRTKNVTLFTSNSKLVLGTSPCPKQARRRARIRHPWMGGEGPTDSEGVESLPPPRVGVRAMAWPWPRGTAAIAVGASQNHRRTAVEKDKQNDQNGVTKDTRIGHANVPCSGSFLKSFLGSFSGPPF